ncbi:Hypothetical predicted protein [Mytilus galloprovincialis]|uniref:Transposable element P transposase-like RNase H domain-containing protein n=1 Tax=Mytilus galloprovincialis TaxID=29158 RepID=A0A8B6EB69_MYTGA|nr:Hypothetical predicted protein [Mytilus galloprovincialis]
MIKDSKFLVLPHECTLREYTQFTTPGCGSNPEVLLRIVQEHLNEVPDFKRNVSLLFDEVEIKSGLVYCSETGNLIGFCDIGSVRNDLATFGRQCNEKEEKIELATHMLTFMVKGIFSSVESVFAYYPCTGFNSYQLYWVVWDAIGNLEIVGFRVRAIVCDGATPNRKLYRLHSTAVNQGVCNYITNLYFPERRIYFFCDVPHLLKTTRNNLENSNWHKTRNLHYNGQSLQWTQIVRLVENDLQGLGLRLRPRITVEHLYLTPTLRMRVKLAAQERTTITNFKTICLKKKIM